MNSGYITVKQCFLFYIYKHYKMLFLSYFKFTTVDDVI